MEQLNIHPPPFIIKLPYNANVREKYSIAGEMIRMKLKNRSMITFI